MENYTSTIISASVAPPPMPEQSTFTLKIDKQKLRRLELLKKGGLFSPVPADIQCKQATTVSEYRSAYNIVYKSYIENKYMLPNASNMRVRAWETTPDTGTFICKKGNSPIAVTSTVLDSDEILLPSDNAFHEELNAMRDEGALLCEISNQAIIPEYRNTSVVTELMQAAYGYAWYSEATDMVCAISPKQRKFFELIGFEQVGPIKSYSDEIYDPVALLRLKNIQTRYSSNAPGNKTLNEFWDKFFITQNPYIPIFPLWRHMVQMLFNDKNQTSDLFANCTELFEEATIEQRMVIEKNLGLNYSKQTARFDGTSAKN